MIYGRVLYVSPPFRQNRPAHRIRTVVTENPRDFLLLLGAGISVSRSEEWLHWSLAGISVVANLSTVTNAAASVRASPAQI